MISRKTYLIKPKLQLKYILMSMFLTLISAGVIYLALCQALFNSGWLAELDISHLEGLQRSFHFYFFWAALALLIISSLDILFRFHRVMGPIYAAERSLKVIGAGDLTQEIRTRKQDELKDFTNELSAMREGLRRLVETDRSLCRALDERLAKISSSLANADASLRGEMESIRKDLAAVTSQFRISTQ